jgi:glycogen debranching enzyme
VNEVDVTRATVIKAGNAFCIAGLDGELPGGGHALGLYVDDCRHLSRHELRLNGMPPRLLVSSDQAGAAAVYELTNPDMPLSGGSTLPLQALRVRMERRIGSDGLDETIVLRSQHHEPVELELTLRLDADFAPMLELRGMVDAPERQVVRRADGSTLELSALGSDGWTRATAISCDGARAIDDGTLQATVRLEPRAAHQMSLSARFTATPPAGNTPRTPALSRSPAARQAAVEAQAWLGDRAQLHTGDELVDRIVRRSLLDLRMLISELDGRPFVAAGVPWYATLFGRDSVISALQLLAFDQAPAAGTLRLLAANQGSRTDDDHDEQPGKMLHELRLGEVANADRTPFARYYGSADVTALYLVLLCRFIEWAGALELYSELRPQVEAALQWLEDLGDVDGDGLIEYERRAPGGLENQGWKDSWDGVCDEHGRPLRGPIALVEVQGYAVRARREVAQILDRLGERERAAALEASAERTRRALDAFWLPDLGAYAMALDGDKRPARVLASNQGHLLWAGAVDPDHARSVRDRLMSDALDSGWGVRTLGAEEVAFNPVGYHTGSVWPHDTALIAAGLRRYGFDADFLRLCEGLLDAAAAFHEYRLPELFAGFSREDYEPPVPYPVACRPQAWAAGSIPYVLISSLGLTADGLNRTLRIRRPLLPRQFDALWLRGLRIADATVDLRFERVHAGEPAAAVTDTHVDGPLEVVVEPTPERPTSPPRRISPPRSPPP